MLIKIMTILLTQIVSFCHYNNQDRPVLLPVFLRWINGDKKWNAQAHSV